MHDKPELFHSLEEALKKGNSQRSQELIQTFLDKGTPALSIVDDGLVPAIRSIGDLFEKGELFLPHLMRAAEVMKKSMLILSPLITKGSGSQQVFPPVILGTVEGDIHDIGKNIVALLLSASGFPVIDLGASVSIKRFIEEVEKTEHSRVIIGLSSLLTTTMIQQKHLISTLIESGLRDRVKVMVGGACVSREWASEIGCEGYGLNAHEAVKLALSFC